MCMEPVKSSSERLSRMFKPATVLMLATLLAACNSSSGNGDDVASDDNGDSDVAVGTCDGSVTLAAGTDGLSGDADMDTIQVFPFANDLCALDPSTGDIVTLDSELNPDLDSDVELVVPRGNAQGNSAATGMRVDRVIYTAEDNIRFVEVVDAGDSMPSPQRLSAEDAADDVDMMFLAADYSDPDNAGLMYRKTDGSGKADWYSVRLGDDETIAPIALDGDLTPFGPITDPDSGEAVGWLVHRSNSGQANDEILQLDLDLNPVGSALYSELEGIGRAMRMQFDDGGILLSETYSSQSDFLYYEPGSPGTVTRVGQVSDTNPAHLTSNGEALFMTGKDSSGIYLWRVDGTEVIELDSAPSGNQPTMAIAAGDRVAWAWRTTDDSWDTTLASVTAENGSGRVELETLIDAGSTTFMTSVNAGVDGWIFYHTSGLNPTAYARPADGSTSPISHADSAWQGVSQRGEQFIPFGDLAPRDISEVFLSTAAGGATPDDHDLSVLDAANPADTPVELGTFDEQSGVPMVFMSRYGLGPHRLLVTANDLVYANTRVTGSVQTVVTDSEPGARFRLLGGF